VNKIVDAQVPVLGDVVQNPGALVPLVRAAPRADWFADIARWSGDHRVHVLVRLDEALHQDRPRVVVREELGHLLRQLRGRAHAERLDAHRLGELDKVRVRHARVRVPLVVEQVCGTRALSLQDHALEVVVEDEDLDASPVLARGRELHRGHAADDTRRGPRTRRARNAARAARPERRMRARGRPRLAQAQAASRPCAP
jgi:hypothetical protein